MVVESKTVRSLLYSAMYEQLHLTYNTKMMSRLLLFAECIFFFDKNLKNDIYNESKSIIRLVQST